LPLFIFARFHALSGREAEVAAALREVVAASRQEPGCRAIEAFRSTRDARLLWISSQWVDEAAFEEHAGLPHTVSFLEVVGSLIDHPLDVTRAVPLS
jgi:quinol monooxygenase YgiN